MQMRDQACICGCITRYTHGASHYGHAAVLQGILCYKENGQHIHEDADLFFFCLSNDKIDQSPGDYADGDAFRDAISQGHCDDAQESGDGVCHILKINLCHRAHHIKSHNNQGWGNGETGDA